jgi:hypothetical protein
MPRLPIPGTDDGIWGDVLNEYLAVSHNTDGSLKQSSIVGALTTGSIPQSTISNLTDDLAGKVSASDLAQVATTGSYVDLTNKPTIPSTASDVGAVSVDSLDTHVANHIGDLESATKTALDTTYAQKIDVPTGIVTSTTITRIIASTNPDEPLQDGDLLLVLPQPVSLTFFTDFSGYTTGSQPNDWTQRWVSAAWTVEPDVNATGGKVLRQAAASDARRALSWDLLDAEGNARADAEVVFKWRVASSTAPARAFVRGSGNAGAETGYYGANRNQSAVTLARYIGGTSTQPIGSEAAISLSSNTWHITRMRVEGTTLMAKVWAAANAEPLNWQVSTSDATVSAAGWIGLLSFGGTTKDFDWFGCALGGATAPMVG